jgi:hypothetical protein
MERYRQVLLSSNGIKEILKLSSDSDVFSIIAVQKQPSLMNNLKNMFLNLTVIKKIATFASICLQNFIFLRVFLLVNKNTKKKNGSIHGIPVTN